MNLKSIFKNYFQYFYYFYRYLGYRVFVAFILSLFLGVLDGFGLAMFIPLLKMSNSDTSASGEDLGNLSFLPEFLNSIGIELNIINALIIILVFFSLKGVVGYLEGFTRVVYQQKFIREIRVSNINFLNSFDYGEFVKSDVGRIQNTFSAEVERVNVAYRTYFKSMQYGVLVAVYVFFAFSANPRFALIVAIGGVLTNFIFKWMFEKTKALSKKYTVHAHKFQSLLIQQVAVYKYLKATGLNKFFGKKLIRSIDDIEVLQRKIGIVDSSLKALREPVTILIVVIAILIQVQYFDSDIGLIILSLLFLYRALTFLMALQETWNKFLGVSGSLDNMTEFTNELRDNKEENGNLVFNKFSSSIKLNDLSFCYDGTQILDNISLKINRNETIAIVGESGSGKTTLMNLIAGLLVPTSGEIIIDQIKYSNIDLYSLRQKIGYISQEAPVFNDTVFNNVTFWAEKNDLNLKKFEDALRKAAIYDFVNSLPQKEDEYLGNNGINISGGQKQRLSIARELFKDVDFLFMDEATSALDGETERAIQKNIEALHGEYTIFMVAHRLATIKNADRIILLNNGKIDGIGTFNELTGKSIRFRQMLELQGMNA